MPLRPAAGCDRFISLVHSPFDAVDRPLIVSRNSSRGAACRRRGGGSDGEGCWGVSGRVGVEFEGRMRVRGGEHGLDITRGEEVSGVISSRANGSARVDRRVPSASATFRVVGASLRAARLRTSHVGAPPRTSPAVAQRPRRGRCCVRSFVAGPPCAR